MPTPRKTAAGVHFRTLQELAHSGAVQVQIVGGSAGWYIRARVGVMEQPLLSQRGHIRRFGSADSALALVRNELGLASAEVDVSRWDTRQAAA